jgi:hypothetical protein
MHNKIGSFWFNQGLNSVNAYFDHFLTLPKVTNRCLNNKINI